MINIDAFSDAQLKAFAGQHLHVHSLDAILAPSLIYAYGVTNDLTVIARLPFVTRRDIREGHHSHGPGGDTVDARGDFSASATPPCSASIASERSKDANRGSPPARRQDADRQD